jgi:hypothetical protein
MRLISLLAVVVGADEVRDEMAFMLALDDDRNTQLSPQEVERNAQLMATDFQLARIKMLTGHPELAAHYTALGEALKEKSPLPPYSALGEALQKKSLVGVTESTYNNTHVLCSWCW